MAVLPLALITLAFFVALLAPRLLRQVAIDRCLDRGGRFDYTSSKCESTAPTAAPSAD